ncbi:adenylosuccinate lyase [Pleomorphochaeta sp. DL1XJH-081]|uniref:adenylosuccinate lyase n=1 Tax=Pleomorphochaeta sp. DL1XJH-081 TaxID=3409690 RepID=UPI003BB6A06F
MDQTFGHETYISPFTWRYGSESMRKIWSEHHKRTMLRHIWVALAKAQQTVGLVSAEQVADLEAHKEDIDIARATEIEREIHHDLMAEIKTYAEQCSVGGSIIHLGATSMDILDNMDVLRQRQALRLIIESVKRLLHHFAERIVQTLDKPCMAFTHIQPAEPTTVGYRLAQTAQDLLDDLQELERVHDCLKGKGLKGAVGTSASYKALLEGTGLSPADLESLVMDDIGLTAFDAATQVYTRKQDWRLGVALAGTCATMAKFAFDFRLLQSPPIGEWNEPFGAKQVGSSAMPFKRNPINSEKIDSLCRLVAPQVDVLWHNAAETLLERTLDDSANRRLVIPQLFLATDEILSTAEKLVKGAVFNDKGIENNILRYGLFAASERLLMELGRRGANRQEMHEVIREHSLKAWPLVQQGAENPMSATLAADSRITTFIPKEEIISLLDASEYVGDAPERAKRIVDRIQSALR